MSRLERELKEKLQQSEQQEEVSIGDRIFVFFSTLILLYFLFFGIRYIILFIFGISIGLSGMDFTWMNITILAIVWIASFYSAYRNRSILDDVMKML